MSIRKTSPRTRRIVVLAVPPIEELDLVGPVQVLSTARRLVGGHVPPYEIRVVIRQTGPSQFLILR